MGRDGLAARKPALMAGDMGSFADNDHSDCLTQEQSNRYNVAIGTAPNIRVGYRASSSKHQLVKEGRSSSSCKMTDGTTQVINKLEPLPQQQTSDCFGTMAELASKALLVWHGANCVPCTRALLLTKAS